ncbi:23S rRNA (uridine(2552)-2'-O)-methyltransferase RlmE [Sodalis sp. CWE]|uniref:23S rRNA (uridine(2552)-2'-O)-methyltransferase RlmE n=1 Tax=Sodalis sp. CWE TaxID=2803816 RepID=UPI001C7D4FA4|nr:23S rRNA (uridine(2552)-2'-O)-methyltransferase RlmE [Sodalis sp. CWE]MBX4180792.1 23S rRNA (uridine(2552)-2'-O)-methyltransferase RlmE [Sodalis sp. CWE]
MKKHSPSSCRWLHRNFNDKYVQKTKEKKLRSRAWFKIDAIQKNNKLLEPGMTVIDLGAAPGGWSKYAAKKIGNNGSLIACDILSMSPIVNVNFIHGDFREPAVVKNIYRLIGKKKVQLILSDLSPNISGVPEIDIPKSIHLAQSALNFCRNILSSGGNFLVKIFQGESVNDYIKETRSLFTKVKICKPDSSRTCSREVYIVAMGRIL